MKKPFGKLLGSGTYGKFYKVYGKPLAIKHIKKSSTGLQELGELNYLKMFKHPYLLHCVDFGIYNGLAITLPLASGDMFDIMKNTIMEELDTYMDKDEENELLEEILSIFKELQLNVKLSYGNDYSF